MSPFSILGKGRPLMIFIKKHNKTQADLAIPRYNSNLVQFPEIF